MSSRKRPGPTAASDDSSGGFHRSPPRGSHNAGLTSGQLAVRAEAVAEPQADHRGGEDGEGGRLRNLVDPTTSGGRGGRGDGSLHRGPTPSRGGDEGERDVHDAQGAQVLLSLNLLDSKFLAIELRT